MANLQSPALSEILKDARILLNEQTTTNSFWSDPELTTYANDGIKLYFLEVQEHAEGQFDTTADLDIVSGTETVTLPTDCFEVRALYKKRTTEYDILHYNNNLTGSFSLQSGGGNPNTYTPSYFFRGNSLVLRPQPDFNETGGLRLEYTRFPDTMITGGDVMTSGISPVFKELIVMYVVWKAKVKEDLVNGGNTADKAYVHLSALVSKFKDTVGGRSKHPTFVKPFNP